MTEPEQLQCTSACGGNGYIDCWDCGGLGEVEVPDDDMTEMWVRCRTCGGRGGWACPACEQREGPRT
jgi:DnaJ-class molecular chaperone